MAQPSPRRGSTSSSKTSSSSSSSKSSSKTSPKSTSNSKSPSKSPSKSSKSPSSSRDSGSSSSYKSAGSYETHSTAPTSVTSHSHSRTAPKAVKAPKAQPSYNQDISPVTSCYPRSSSETYNSSAASEMELDQDMETGSYDDYQETPPLPIYRSQIVEPSVRPSTPQDFAKLFPSMNRLSIRHDEFTPDGNMNLRVDTLIPSRRRAAMQLFHLRMYDLGKREFSLRRYCRDSGREVCNSKRKYIEPAAEGRPTLQRSVSSAFKSLGRPQHHRNNSGGSLFSTKSGKSEKRPGSSHSARDADDEFGSYFDHPLSPDHKLKARPVPTNTMKLEFSNYARVDVERRGGTTSKRYEFEWWGHKYAWKRVTDKHLNVVSFHLMRDGTSTPVAHIVPETRSPNQVQADEQAGGWVPPCHMWISDESIVEAMTDIADVIVATGLMALVDDCIKERWQTKKVRRISVPLTFKTVDVEYAGHKSLAQRFFHRKNSSEHPPSPLRQAKPISAY